MLTAASTWRHVLFMGRGYVNSNMCMDVVGIGETRARQAREHDCSEHERLALQP